MRSAIVALEVPTHVGEDESDVREWVSSAISIFADWSLVEVAQDVETEAWLSGFDEGD